MKPWSDVVAAFRDRMAIDMPKSEFIMWALLVMAIIALLWWLMLYTQKRKQYRKRIRLLNQYDLSPSQRKLLEQFVREGCHGRAADLPLALSVFNLWVGRKLEEESGQGWELAPDHPLLVDIRNLRSTVFRGTSAGRPYASSRDLDLNTSLSVDISGYSTTLQAIVTSLDDLGLRISLLGGQDSIRPTPGTPLFVSIAQPEALYNFEAEFISQETAGTFTISHSRDWHTVQMRMHYRHPVHLPLSFTYFNRLPDGEVINGQGSGTLVELSGGGFTLISHFKGIEGGNFVFDLSLEGRRMDQITGVIKRMLQDRSGSDYIIYNCEFLDLDPLFRDGIVQYIFSKQLEIQ